MKVAEPNSLIRLAHNIGLHILRKERSFILILPIFEQVSQSTSLLLHK